MLHTLMRSPFKLDISSFIKMLKDSDDFLALQDGVLITSVGNIFLDSIVLSSAKLYVIKEDLYARGLYKYLSSHFTPISYTCFVSLTLKNKQQMVW